MAESFSRQKSRHAPQKEGGLKILCDLPPVTPAGTSNELDVQNGWEENTHTHIYISNEWSLRLSVYLWRTSRGLERRKGGTVLDRRETG